MISWLKEKLTRKCRRCGRQMIEVGCRAIAGSDQSIWVCPVSGVRPYQNCEKV